MACWMSYGSNHDPEWHHLFGHGCMISVSLDSGAHEIFAGIRLLVVCKASLSNQPGLENLVRLVGLCVYNQFADPSQSLKDCVQPTEEYSIVSSGHPQTYRQSLSRYAYDAERSRQLSQTLHNPDARPLCTVAFEIVQISDYMIIDNTIRIALLPLKLAPSEQQRIIYERVYPCTPTRHCFMAILNSSQPFGFRGPNLLPPRAPDYFLPSGSRAILVEHSIRIMPISVPRSLFRPLPCRVLRHIVQYAFERKKQGWRKDLLAIGLVCKGWSHVLGLFFQGLPSAVFTEHYSDPPNAIAVSRSLEMRPDRAELIQHFNPRAFISSNAEDEEVWKRSEALVAILQQATSLKEVHLCDIHTSHVSAARDALSQLHEMKKFYADRSMLLYRNVGGFTMLDLQRAISNSKDLRIFRAASWHRGDDTELVSSSQILSLSYLPVRRSISLHAVQLPPLTRKLESLELFQGNINGPQFLHFATPRLRTLRLYAVTGLVNSDLLSFLSQVAPILETLIIESTTILRNSKDEEYAIDAAMPLMTNLVSLTISGDLGSVLVLTRKPATPQGSLRRAVLIFLGVSANVLGMDSIIMAAGVTLWDVARLSSDVESGNAWNEYSRMRASEIARKRGIEFSCNTSI